MLAAIVDDDLDTCEMLDILLGDAGYEITFATSVAEGLSLANSKQCDLILLDGLFKDSTGIESNNNKTQMRELLRHHLLTKNTSQAQRPACAPRPSYTFAR
jgi:DNA-binding response OmpR family regulator